ncbi:MAG TPA: serine/threonine-protein kinase [Myxococcales bacterium]|nr:serine/threonine-protein kinase [Myxococcales bacterium]
MNPDRRLPDLFAHASELEGEARAAWLTSLRHEDAALARELEELLAAAPAGERRFATLAHTPEAAAARDEMPLPDQVGPYRVVREIGRGGMGRVFLAEQQTPTFRRVVALKVLDRLAGHGLGGSGEEARILASLEHPGIARFYDAGQAEDGRQYLALEYVEGEDLLAFVHRRGAGIRKRVELFLQLLDAVDFAHRRLVVHRDLKPGNVLVGPDGNAKLLDFGISRIVHPGDEGDATRTGQRALTPAYASPEQLRGERAAVASDVYSLGVMLYEVLAGRRPFDRSAALDPDSLPDPPSSAGRKGEGPVRWQEVAGDLDAIVLKALRPEAPGRYPSAAAFADDLRRWLDGKPVEARRGGRRYRLAKFMRRNQWPVAFAMLAVLALGGGVAGILVQSRQAARAAALAAEQRDFAMRQLSRAEAINELDAFLLSDAAPGGKPFTVRELLGRAEQILDLQRGGSDENRAEILVSLGQQYLTLEEDGKARQLLGKAYELAARSGEVATRAKAACALADAVGEANELERGEKLLAEGMALLPQAPQFVLHRVFCLLRGSSIARAADNGQLAIERCQEAQRLLRESAQGTDLLELRVAMDLAESYRMAQRFQDADKAFAQSWALLEGLGRAQTDRAGTLLNNWGLVVRALGRPLAAEKLFRRAIGISSADGGQRGVAPMLLTNHARTLMDIGRLAEARDRADRAYAEARRAGDEGVVTFALYLRNLVYLRLGDLARAAQTLAELEPREARLPPGHYRLASLASQRALLAQARGDKQAARADHDRAVALAEKRDAQGQFLLRRSSFELQDGRAEQARSDAARALALEQAATAPATLSSRVGLAQLALASALRVQGKSGEALAAVAVAREHLEATLGGDDPDSGAARELQLGLQPAR